MSARLVVYEWILLWRDRRAAAALLCLAAMLLIAFAANATMLAREEAAKRAVAATERARWLAQPAKDPHSAAHYSIFAFKPAAALAALDLGVEPFVGQAVWLEAHVQNDLLYRPQGEATLLERAGLRHPAALLIAFAPLVAFLLAFGAAARERERGSLRLALGAARDPRTLVLGKAAAVWLALAGALVLPLAAAAALLATAQSAWSADLALRLAAWSAGALVYLAVFAAAGVAVALRAPDARLALAALFGAWAVLVLALPRFANSAALALQPLPPTQAVKQQLLDEAPSYWTAETARANEAAILAHAGVARREELHGNFRGLELDHAERHSHAVYDRVLGGFHDQVIAQDRRFAALSWFSPAIALSALSPALTGTDFAQHRQFIDAAERYRRELVNAMNAAVIDHHPGADSKAWAADAALWAAQPEFRAPRPTLAAADTGFAALPALAAWLAAALGGLFLTARRLQP